MKMEKLLERDLRENNHDFRCLNGGELFLESEMKKKCFIISQVFIISSKIDLFADISKLDNAIIHWKMLHPMLRCRILNKEFEKKYFSYASKETIIDTSNISYLTYKSSSNSDKKFYWKTLFERELNITFDSENGPLWRLLIIKLNNHFVKCENEFSFAFILSIHHVISDGKNVYAIMLELCDLIEKSFKDELKEISEDEYMESLEEVYYPNDPRTSAALPKVDSSSNTSEPKNFVPEFSKTKDLSENITANSTVNEIDDDGEFYLLDGTLFQKASELKYESQYLNNTKLRTLELNKQLYENLLKKAKDNSAKFNSVLVVATAIATANFLRNFSDEFRSKSFTLLYKIPINLRQFLNLPYTLVGNWLSRFFENFKVDTEDKFHDEFYREKFWKIAKEHTDNFLEKIEAQEHFKALKNPFKKNTNAEITDEIVTHFSISNIGVLQSTLNESSLLKINEFYSGMSFKRERVYCYTQHGWSTIDSKLHLCLSYSAKHMSEEIVDSYVSSLKQVFNNIQTHC